MQCCVRDYESEKSKSDEKFNFLHKGLEVTPKLLLIYVFLLHGCRVQFVALPSPIP